jgi:RHS repeat-associated protein
VKRAMLLLWFVAVPAIAAAQQPETIEYYGQDVIGSVRVVWDANGNVLGRQDFTPFGTPVTVTPPASKEGFGGQEKDHETDQSYLHARMFGPSLGRFVSPDPVQDGVSNPQGWNRHAYARNRPLVFVDPGGLNAGAPTFTGTSVPACEDFNCGISMELWMFFSGFGWGGGGGGASGGGGAGGSFGSSSSSGTSTSTSTGAGDDNGNGNGNSGDDPNGHHGGAGPNTPPAPPAPHPNPTGDAQINLIGKDVWHRTSEFAKTSTYGELIAGSAVGGAFGAAGLEALAWGKGATWSAFIAANGVIAGNRFLSAVFPGGVTQGIMDAVSGWSPGPAGSSLFEGGVNTICNNMRCPTFGLWPDGGG